MAGENGEHATPYCVLLYTGACVAKIKHLPECYVPDGTLVMDNFARAVAALYHAALLSAAGYHKPTCETRKRKRPTDNDAPRRFVFYAGEYKVSFRYHARGCARNGAPVADNLASKIEALYFDAQEAEEARRAAPCAKLGGEAARRAAMAAKHEAYARLAGYEILGAIYAKYDVAFDPPADVHFARDSLDRALRVDGCTLHVRVDRMQRQTVTPPGDMRPFTAIVTALDIDLDQFVRDMHVAARGFSDAVLAVFSEHGVRVPASSIRTSDGRLKIDGVAVDVAPDATAPADAPPWTRSNIPPGFFAALFAAVDTLPAWPEVVWRASN